MRVFLIDFENVKSDGLRSVDCLEAGDQVITFFSKNAESMSMDTYFNLIHSKAKFYAVRLDRTGSNALDFQLVSYLGYLMGTNEDQDVYVISKDHGFYSAVSFCRNFLIPQAKFHKTVTQYPSIASLFPNREEGTPVGINAIPLFLHPERPELTVQAVRTEMPEAVKEEQPETQSVPVKEPALEEASVSGSEQAFAAAEPQKKDPAVKSAPVEAEAVSVQPKRRDYPHGRQPRAPYANANYGSKQPRKAESDSAWNEISAAAEVGLAVIDMFGEAAPAKEEKSVAKAASAEKPAEKSDEIQIIDLLTPMKQEFPKAEALTKDSQPVQAEESSESPKEDPVETAAAEVKKLEQEEANPEEKTEMLSGAEIDQMLNEFLEEAKAAVAEQLKELPEEQPVFIEVEPAAKEQTPDKEADAKPEPSAKRIRTREPRRNQRKPETKEKETKPENKPIQAEPAKEQPVKEPVKKEVAPAKKEQSEKAAPVPAGQKDDPAARELVKKVLTETLEIKDEETGRDLEKLTDCILGALGKQDLYRKIIRLFGQKTGLEYYKVVKREYTNICNQLSKK